MPKYKNPEILKCWDKKDKILKLKNADILKCLNAELLEL